MYFINDRCFVHIKYSYMNKKVRPVHTPVINANLQRVGLKTLYIKPLFAQYLKRRLKTVT